MQQAFFTGFEGNELLMDRDFVARMGFFMQLLWTHLLKKQKMQNLCMSPFLQTDDNGTSNNKAFNLKLHSEKQIKKNKRLNAEHI